MPRYCHRYSTDPIGGDTSTSSERCFFAANNAAAFAEMRAYLKGVNGVYRPGSMELCLGENRRAVPDPPRIEMHEMAPFGIPPLGV